MNKLISLCEFFKIIPDRVVQIKKGLLFVYLVRELHYLITHHTTSSQPPVKFKPLCVFFLLCTLGLILFVVNEMNIQNLIIHLDGVFQ